MQYQETSGIPSTCEPQLSLIQERDGEYTLIATTYMPNACFVADEASPRAPAASALTPDTFPVTLEVREQGAICAPYLKPVRHRLRNLDLRGKRQLTAFVVKEGEILGQASLEIPEQMPPVGEQLPIETSDWYAWANLMPGPSNDPRLHVEGKVTLPNPCYSARLERIERQPSGPKALDLALKIAEPPRDMVCPQVVVERTVSFETRYEPRYERVNIHLADGQVLTVKVQEAH